MRIMKQTKQMWMAVTVLSKSVSFIVSDTPAPSTSLLVPHHMVILGIVSGLVVTVIIISVVITCKQKKREEALRKAARQHAESLNTSMEMATLLNKSPHATHTIRSNNSPVMNHVTRLTVRPNGNGINLPNDLHQHQRIGRSVSNNPSENEGSEIDMGEGTFRRYLDVNNYNDEDSSPNPSTCNTIPALVTVEHHPSPRSLSIDGSTPRDKAPSPRPDVVQQERFTYPDPPPPLIAQPQERLLQPQGVPTATSLEQAKPKRPMAGQLSNHKSVGAKATNNSGSFKSHGPPALQDGPYRSANKAPNHNKAQAPNRKAAAIATALSPGSPDITKATRPYAGLKVTNVDNPDDTIIITDNRPVTSFRPLPPKRTSSTGSPARLERRSADTMQDGRIKPFASNHTSSPSPTSQNVWQHHPV